MATISFQDLLDRISRIDNTTVINGDAINAAEFSANAEGKVVAAATHGTVNTRTDAFTGLSRSRGVNPEALLERLKTAKETLEIAPENKGFQKMVDQAKKDLERQAENIYRDAGRAHALHAEAITYAERDADKLLKQAGKSFDQALTALQKEIAVIPDTATHVLMNTGTGSIINNNIPATFSAAVGQRVVEKNQYFSEASKSINDNHLAAQKLIQRQLSDFKEVRGDHMKSLKTAAAEIEKETSVAHAAHFEAKAVQTAVNGEKAAAAAGGNIISRGFKAFGKAPGLNKVGAGVGSIIVLAGLKDAAQVVGAWPKATDEQGKEVPTDGGKLIKTAAELGGGLFVITQALKGHMPAKGL